MQNFKSCPFVIILAKIFITIGVNRSSLHFHFDTYWTAYSWKWMRIPLLFFNILYIYTHSFPFFPFLWYFLWQFFFNSRLIASSFSTDWYITVMTVFIKGLEKENGWPQPTDCTPHKNKVRDIRNLIPDFDRDFTVWHYYYFLTRNSFPFFSITSHLWLTYFPPLVCVSIWVSIPGSLLYICMLPAPFNFNIWLFYDCWKQNPPALLCQY